MRAVRPLLVALLLGAISLAVACSGGGSTPTATQPSQTTPSQTTLTVANIDGPNVMVQLWDSASPVEVKCGATTEVPTAGAPAPPWHLTVRNAAGGAVLLDRTIEASAGSLGVIVRSDGALLGPWPASGGPAPQATCPPQ